jgi:hypothetical protein
LKCRHLLEDPAFAKSHYHVKSSVTPAAFKQFVETIQGEVPNVTQANADDLTSLCSDFGFDDLREAIAKTVSGASDLEGTPIHYPENVQTLFPGLDSAIPMSGDYLEVLALSAPVGRNLTMQTLCRISLPPALKARAIPHDTYDDCVPGA